MDRFTSEIIKDALVATGDEMFSALARTAMSTIIYETLDFAVGLTDAKGELLTQGDGVTLFLATLDTTVQEILTRYGAKDDIHDGDVFIANDPYGGGGTHLSDVSIVLPVFFEGELVAFTVNKAHWTEVGGASPGSVSANATEVYQEGLQFPYVKLIEQGRVNQALIDMIAANVRLPESTIGDMWAGVAAARVGARRLHELMRKFGRENVKGAMADLLEYGERMTRLELRRIPDGVYEAEDIIESDGLGNGPFTIKVRVIVDGESVTADFTGTAAQAPGPINCSLTSLSCAVRTIVKSLTNPDIPANGGCFRPVNIICPPGTIISAERPAPTSIYYETDTAAADLMWKALAPIAPDRLPAGHMRSVCGTFLSGRHADTGEYYIFGEPLVGGWGAAHDADGQNGQFCCGDGETYNIPVELTEARYGIQVDQYAFHNHPGGAGQYRGGKGVVLDYRMRADEAALTVTFSRDSCPPWGLNGGQDGTPNYVEILRANGARERHSMVTALPLQKDDVVRLVTATGGGYGDPRERAPEAIEADLRNGFITPEEAREVYGIGDGS
ncbi:hydantoinase B/oxoprolinase family protein [Luteithermobacter gelatinilyticus]|uniref:hydantoinase B/oxoprolinase family protein n=1 Tax=Luteithermobacter gelatinilyticus TaxID=2582913 RepID=UPI0011072402|nr:hydantoinase B/oxoprolinase family protein [Luteithermobacter gelatinilyticus]